MKKHSILAYIFISISLFACKQKTASTNPAINDGEQFIQISQKQFLANEMEIGTLSLHSFADIIACNGYVSAPPNGIANSSTPISGIVKSIQVTAGDYVKKGQVLCEIESNDFIALQQDFSETAALLHGLTADYERNKALYSEKIGAEKDLISSESIYKATKAKFESLKLKLQVLKLDSNKIKEGQFYSSLAITSPISGYITKYNLMLGQFTEQQKSLFEIVDPNQLQIQISVFEKDIHQLKIGQKLQFKTQNNSNEAFTAHLSAIGKGIDPQTKSILCLAKIDDNTKGKLFNGSFIEAEITTNEKNAEALPSQAIIKSGTDHYVFVLAKNDEQNYYLRKEKIKIGSESKGFSEILDPQNLAKVIINGVYNISVE
ncbi:hypothetical protein BZG02_14655 [Labilibaculum filiforme]|uniref:Uncharacterized protein n=1 Tax=Labilibaculum filiforme TaxID=1940526 RepID=A0A2N3HUZ2_9BACT|nr:efflux RND transporter periplasmic adaptor subunit [Labilibaculum filiforme]PKQ61863.1 hypothetical protein BZG02_14655 [Labilibaculum filiforme]